MKTQKIRSKDNVGDRVGVVNDVKGVPTGGEKMLVLESNSCWQRIVSFAKATVWHQNCWGQ